MKTQSMVFAVLALGACGTSSAPKSLVPASWGQCEEGFTSECTILEAPLSWIDDDDTGRIALHLARRPANSEPASTQLWLVMGGPGDSADAFLNGGLITALDQLLPAVDVYVPEHRGVGLSSRLACPVEESPNSPMGFELTVEEHRTCYSHLRQTWGKGLERFTVAEAARDLHALIEAFRGDSTVILYSVSYGTLLAHALVEQFPDSVDALILDSVYVPGVQGMDAYDGQFGEVARGLSQLCADDTTCADQMPDPWALLRDGWETIRTGQCEGDLLPNHLHREFIRDHLDEPVLRSQVFSVAARAARCTPDDAAVVAHYLNRFVAGKTSNRRSSAGLTVNIVLADQWSKTPPPIQSVVDACYSDLFCPGVSRDYARISEFWQVTTQPQIQRLRVNIPVLAMNGSLDPRNPIALASELRSDLSAPHQHFLTFPNVNHVVIRNSVSDGDPVSCGLQMMVEFIQNPQQPLDTACLGRLSPLDFVGRADENRYWFGTPNRWVGPVE